MVKKAENLKSLDELTIISSSTKALLEEEGCSLDEVVWRGRYISYSLSLLKSGMFAQDLMKALDKEGYIRHDINSGSFAINRIYQKVFGNTINLSNRPAEFDEFCAIVSDTEQGRIINVDYHVGNERYENFVNPTESQIDAVKKAMETCLSKKEYAVIAYKFGFEDGEAHYLEQVAKHFDISRKYAHQTELNGLRKLRISNTLSMEFLS